MAATRPGGLVVRSQTAKATSDHSPEYPVRADPVAVTEVSAGSGIIPVSTTPPSGSTIRAPAANTGWLAGQVAVAAL